MLFLLSAILLFSPAVLQPGSGDDKAMTANDVIEAMKNNLTCAWSSETVDTFKSGDPNDEITGIACTFTATINVLKEAAEKGCNLIITHEPTYYNHLDTKDLLENDPVYKAKQDIIDQNRLIIFRFHDHWHRTDPDGIYKGMIDKLKWSSNLAAGESHVFSLPGQTLAEVTGYMKNIFPEAIIRVIGDPDMKVLKAAFSAGAPSSMSHIRLLQRTDIDLLVIGEAREWETIEYVRDASQAGHLKAVIVLGHVVSEEAGMAYCAKWMRTFVGDIPVHFIPAGDPFHQ